MAAQQAADPGDDAGNIVAHRKQDEAAFRAEGGGEVGGAGEKLAVIQLFAAVRHEGGCGSVALQQGAPTGEGFLHHAMIAPQHNYATVDATMADMAGGCNGSKGVGPAKAREGWGLQRPGGVRGLRWWGRSASGGGKGEDRMMTDAARGDLA